MAKQLVSAMTGEFDPAQYKDEYREALEKIIEAKVEGRETVEIEEPEETGKLIDLMAALEASVSAAKARASRRREAGLRGRGPREEGRPKPAASRTRAKAAEDEEKAKPAARKRNDQPFQAATGRRRAG